MLTEEIKKAYMGQDYHPSFTLPREVENGIERVADAAYKKGQEDERERTEKQIWKSAYITPTNKEKVINGIGAAL